MDTVVFTSSFALLFLAEMGDKSQLIAMSLAGRFRLVPVAVGVMSAFLLLNLLAVAVGQALFQWVPQQLVLLVAGGLFVYFAYRSWREAAAEDAGEARALSATRSALIISFLLIFFAELGDKTQLAMIGLTAGSGAPLSVLAGGTLALWSVSLLGILLGGTLLRRLSPVWMHRASALLFLAFGLFALAQLTSGEAELTALVPAGLLPVASSEKAPLVPGSDSGKQDCAELTNAALGAPYPPSLMSESDESRYSGVMAGALDRSQAAESGRLAGHGSDPPSPKGPEATVVDPQPEAALAAIHRDAAGAYPRAGKKPADRRSRAETRHRPYPASPTARVPLPMPPYPFAGRGPFPPPPTAYRPWVFLPAFGPVFAPRADWASVARQRALLPPPPPPAWSIRPISGLGSPPKAKCAR